MKEKVQVVIDERGYKIVQINEIIFTGKQNINWNSVETYIKQYVGKFHIITETEDFLYLFVMNKEIY